ncbi:hypothetical protein BWI93_09110 [Siphonobacter sp. BAB-5385]|uniref:TetR/AcrR family transcriptional regulator n=1 Tax=unclassified Siphonobacter TaxID=2635712 RepID=UPI000B9E23B7|nr:MULTISPECIES: TetR family transcriptional regulator C-terminal domain-containing protein [unclassified Siphonobacter]OZI08538.1 hypothetical protein BWI93_09110 [Siphonobacter sp. BAB-5385]PMD99075.1 hypothetical protein BWI97_01290 [Siphonobacter sp. BAB-5405]
MATSPDKIKDAYMMHLLEEGQQPASIYAFAKKLKVKETEFYEYYNSFEQIESGVWVGFFEQTLVRLKSDEVFHTYSVREKLLAFYYTWIEVLTSNRSFVLRSLKDFRMQRSLRTPAALEEFKYQFEKFIKDLMAEGRESQEVKSRQLVETKYPTAFWYQTMWLLDFWSKDTSKGFEKTDTAIEKAVNTAFDLIGVSALDSVLDLAKFLYQNR